MRGVISSCITQTERGTWNMDKRSIDDILETIKSLTDEEKVAYLFDIIHEEVSKPWDEVDQELVAACSECAEKYNQNVAPALTEADVEQRLAEFKQNYGKKVSKPIRTNWIRKAAIIAAAAVLTCMLTLTVAAKAYGFQNIGEFVVYAMNNLFPGESVDENKITYIYNGESVEYSSIEEWHENEGTNMLYPTVLPKGVFIDEIFKTQDVDGTNLITYNFNSQSIHITISECYVFDLSKRDDPTYTNSDGLMFYIIRGQEAVCQTETHEYIIKCENYDWLKMIMEGMR